MDYEVFLFSHAFEGNELAAPEKRFGNLECSSFAKLGAILGVKLWAGCRPWFNVDICVDYE